MYAICGFSDLLSYGMLITCLVAVAPSRKKDILATVNRAICAGVIACFLTACMAGKSPISDVVTYFSVSVCREL